MKTVIATAVSCLVAGVAFTALDAAAVSLPRDASRTVWRHVRRHQ